MLKEGHYWICQRSVMLESALRKLVRDAVGDDIKQLWTGFGADEKVTNRVLNAWNHEKNEPIADIDVDLRVG